jgi:putative acetyltransferase
VITIRRDDPVSPAAAALIAHHLAEARAATPAGNAHAADGAGLADPAVTFWTAWDGDALAGMVALKQLDPQHGPHLGPRHGEVKSMRTHPDHLRRGVGRALLAHLLAVARARGYTRVSLETGTAPMFAAANRLYEAAGFVDGPVFGGYPPSPHNRFMTMALDAPRR